LWSLAWAFFLVKRWRTWAFFYGKVNRIAFPVLGVTLILLASPVCDARRIVLWERLQWLRDSVRRGGDIDGFDWRHIARDLGLYGIRALEELRDGGLPEIYAKFGPFSDGGQVEKIWNNILSAVTLVKNTNRAADGEHPNTRRQEAALEEFALSAGNAPVFGGELGSDQREELARRLSKELGVFRVTQEGAEVEFFYLADMNGDGEKETLLGLGDDIWLLRENRAVMLRRERVKNKGSGEANVAVISADRQRIIGNQWSVLQLNDKIFFVGPGDIEEIEYTQE
jgi:hypothetical protein